MKEQNFIYDVTNIRDLAPSILSKEYRAILTVIDALIAKHVVSNIEYLEFLERIDSMSEWELDFVAKELSVDFYDFTMTLEEKRKACKQSFNIHALKGTNRAVQNALNIFYDNSRILEFPEFDGPAGTFQIEIRGNSDKNLEKLINRIEVVKKKSQHLIGISFRSTTENNLYIKTYLRYGNKMNILPQRVYFYLNHISAEHKDGMYTFTKENRGGRNG